ncbi:MAG: hypothetical protein Q9200_001391 [Gallowayella weberi]
MEEWARADIPSLRTVRGLVGELLEVHRYAKVGEIIERNLKRGVEGRNTLDLLNARLELQFGLIRAVTPKYSNYRYIKTPLFEDLSNDDSAVTRMVKKHSHTAIKWTAVDVDAVALAGHFPREHAIRKLQEWNDRGAIRLETTGVINRFKILRNFPQGESAKQDIVTAIYKHFVDRERSDIERVQRVIHFVTSNGCLTQELASHFSDHESIPSEGCRTCSFCVTRKRVEYQPTGAQQRKGRIDEGRINSVLSATKIRDDARFLARIASGFSSPRVTGEKLNRNVVFGSMADCDFEITAAVPEAGSIGGNTGSINSFAGLDLDDSTGGVYQTSDLMNPTKFVCYFY